MLFRSKEVIAYISKHNPGTETDFNAAAELLETLFEEKLKLQAAVIACREKLENQANRNVE